MVLEVICKDLGLCEYTETLAEMRDFTNNRVKDTPDEFWLLEHKAVYTQGQAGKAQHILNPGNIPIIQSDRGGQVTYHGPGQLVIYLLSDLNRLNLGIKKFVCAIEQAVIDLLASYDVIAIRRPKAPGVYVDGAKIASCGIRIRKGCSYHGLSLNIAMDLAPFQGINPCGFANMPVTQLKALGITCDMLTIKAKLCHNLATNLGYTKTLL